MNQEHEGRAPTGLEVGDRPAPPVALVTGGTGALGTAVVRAFLAASCTVVATYRSERGVEELRAAAGTTADRLLLVQTDVTDRASLDPLVADVTARLGRIDYLINCVGGWAGGAPVWETSDDVFRRMVDLNLTAAFACCRAVLPGMVARNYGRIVNVASRSALQPSPGAAAYGAAKAALISLTESLALEAREYDITVNAVVPGVIDTAANRASMPGAAVDRWVRPEAIAAVITWLVSPAATPISGAAIPVYGRS
jgi:NAD(P)-dependent dehydrogenase (short-subunit alcohol dehydrogenase family)